jgi:hypothetical protein
VAIESAVRRPARMYITNISSGETVHAQFNPTEFQEALEVNWARQTVPGLSHQPLQFVHTSNSKFTIDLYFNAQDGTSESGTSQATGPDFVTKLAPIGGLAQRLNQIHDTRRFLQSLCYPRRGAATVFAGGPPRVLFVWPQVVSLQCILTGLSFRYTRFNIDGTPVEFTASVSLEEIRDVRLLSEEVRQNGTQRSGVAPKGV